MLQNQSNQTNYNHYSGFVQLSLPFDLSVKIDSNDPVFSFLEAVEGIDFSKFVKITRSNNTHSHDRVMLLKTLLFAFQEGNRSLTKIAQLCKTDIRYMYLTNEECPSAMAFQRMTEQLKESIDDVFFTISKHIARDLMLCDTDVQYIDGTKIEANAHKNSFVYKKRIMNAETRLFERITEDIYRLNETYGYHYPVKGKYEAFDMGVICQYLMEVITCQNIQLVYGKGKRKSEFQRFYDLFLGYYIKLNEYEFWLNIMGKRNSCSKIDHDATFMATKYDYYNQTGVTRPCYNCQIAVCNGIITNSDVFQNPADQHTWIPFMDRYEEAYGERPKYPVADAGYGSYDNYLYNVEHEIELVQKFSMYGKEEDKQFKKRKFNSLNWKINEEGFKICPDGRVFDQYGYDRIQYTRNDNLSITQIYTEKNHCEGCPLKEECTKGKYRTYGKNVILNELQEKVKENLSTSEGQEMKKERSIQVEGAFGVIKQDMGFTRFTRTGMKSVKMEFLLVCIGYNLRKYHLYRIKTDKKEA